MEKQAQSQGGQSTMAVITGVLGGMCTESLYSHDGGKPWNRV